MKQYLFPVFVFMCTVGFAQRSELIINEPAKGVSLLQVLERLEEAYGLKMAYPVDALKEIEVTQDLVDLTLAEALEQLLDKTGYSFRIKKSGLVIIQTNPGSSDASTKLRHLSGYIRDAESGESIPYAHVRMDTSSARGVITNQDGYFAISDMTGNSQWLMISSIGYQDTMLNITNVGRELLVEITPKVHVLADVEVVGTSPTLEVEDAAGIHSLNTNKIDDLPSLGTRDVFRSLHLLPGVAVAEEISSALSVRGGGEDENLVLMDGFRLFHLDHFAGLFSSINPDAIKSIQLHKGGFSAEYGNAISSVVDITGKSGNRFEPAASAHVSPVNAGAAVEVPVGKNGSFISSIRTSNTGLYESNLYQELKEKTETARIAQDIDAIVVDEEELEQSFQFRSANAKLTYQPSTKDILALSFYYSEDRSEVFSEDPDLSDITSFTLEDEAIWNSTGGSIRWARQTDDKHYSNILLGFSSYESTTDYQENLILFGETSPLLESQTENKVNNFLLSWKNEYVWNAQHTFDAGLVIDYADTQVNSDENAEFANEGVLMSLYLEDAFQLNEAFRIEGGGRYTYASHLSQSFLEPRIRATYDLPSDLQFKLAWGKYHQFLRRVPLEGYRNKFSWVLSDDMTYDRMDATHYIAGIRYQKKNTTLDLEIYHKRDDGVLDNSVTVLAASDNQYLTGERHSYGLDALLQHTRGPFTGWLTYSHMQVENRMDVIEVIAGTSLLTYDASQDRPHQGSFVGMLDLKHWSLAATWIFAAGKPYTPVSDTEAINTLRLPAYHRLDLSGSYRFTFKKWSSVVGINLFNLYNQENIIQRTLEESTMTGLDTDDLLETTSLGFMPTFFLRIGFN